MPIILSPTTSPVLASSQEDIVTAILFYLREVFTEELITAKVGDPYQAKEVLLGPRQEDPTEIGPFVVIELDKEKGRVLRDPDKYAEIGGGTTFWTLNFVIRGWVNLQTTKDDNYIAGGIFSHRVLHSILSNFQLDGLTTNDGTEGVTGCNLDLVDRMTMDPIGGEDTWYMKYRFHVHYYTERSDFN